MPVVSCLMVFHRDTPFLRAAVGSVLGQTWRDLELVLVDNGTGLPATALGELGRDSRINWVRLPRNEGIPAGHNAGIAHARGEYIALLDYDDLARPLRFDRQVELLRARPEVGLVSSLAETIDELDRVTGREFALIEAEAQREYTQFAAPVVTPAYAGRRAVFRELPYRAEFPLAADFDFLARAAEKTILAGVPETLLQYRRYPAQTTQARAAEIEEQRAAIRTLTARRRSARAENLEATVAALQPGPSAAACCLRWAERNLEEGLAVLASYHARRAVVLERSVACMAVAGRLAARAIVAASGAERQLAIRLFFRGPVRALKLTPR